MEDRLPPGGRGGLTNGCHGPVNCGTIFRDAEAVRMYYCRFLRQKYKIIFFFLHILTSVGLLMNKVSYIVKCCFHFKL